jgi:hypothetical protein
MGAVTIKLVEELFGFLFFKLLLKGKTGISRASIAFI